MNVSATFVESESQAYQAQSSETLRATLEHVNSQYRISVVITDLSSQTIVSNFAVSRSDSEGIIQAGDAAAKQLDASSSPFSTRVPEALQAYVQAVTSSDPNARMTCLRNAVQLDPGFGLAYFSAIDVTSGRNPELAQDLLRQASAHRTRFTALDQARLAAISARLSHAPLSEQIAAASALLHATPNSLDALVSLASLRFLQGDAAGGKSLLQKALALSPGNVTVRSYLALGLVETRQFREAERIYESLQNDPVVPPQLAVCILLEGDTTRADSVFAKFVNLQKQAGDLAVPLVQANWLAVSGRVQDAVLLLKTSDFSSPELRSLALSQSAIWELMINQHANATADAAAALKAPASPPVHALAVAASAICSDVKSPQSLGDDVNSVPLRDDQKAVVFAYGLFLTGHFAEAADAWKNILKQSGEADLRSRAMLASSLDRAGKPGGPGNLPVQPFIPNLTADDQFGAVAFAEMRRLLSR